MLKWEQIQEVEEVFFENLVRIWVLYLECDGLGKS